jgi:hypothetical protein
MICTHIEDNPISQPGEMPKLPCKVAAIIMNIADIYMYTSYHIGFVVCSSTAPKLCSASKRGHWF